MGLVRNELQNIKKKNWLLSIRQNKFKYLEIYSCIGYQ